MTLVTCGNCGSKLAVNALQYHSRDECIRIALAKSDAAKLGSRAP
jgi:hypothetical protein